ncbi:Nucleic acid-binding protein [Corchorus olitorius]|uniref:Nucleic acid-binding protein n=1 Tax=Corchorus olitorius TaxID=93759 RepID=A0A1R3KPN2_9ROSI|nr:Nucleic acid-binding protein [Corchorus olitorius]
MAGISIFQLAPPGLNQVIRLRITRIWDCIVPTSERVIGLAFLATDNQGQSIHVQIGQRDIEHFRALLIEGALYLLSGFRVSRPNINLIAVRSSQIIWLTSRSNLIPIDDYLGPYPRHYFDFNYMIGMLMQIHGEIIDEIPGTNRMARRKDMTIFSLHNREITVRPWDDALQQIDVETLFQITLRPVLIFAGMLTKTGEHDPYLTSCCATKIFVNLHLNETAIVQAVKYGTERMMGLAFLATHIMGNALHVQIARRDAERFRTLLIEGAVYLFLGFRVSKPYGSFIGIRSHHVMWLTSTSLMIPIEENMILYPRHYFDFTCENRLNQLRNRTKYLADIIGKLSTITEEAIHQVPGIGRIRRRRDLAIITLDQSFPAIFIAQFLVSSPPLTSTLRCCCDCRPRFGFACLHGFWEDLKVHIFTGKSKAIGYCSFAVLFLLPEVVLQKLSKWNSWSNQIQIVEREKLEKMALGVINKSTLALVPNFSLNLICLRAWRSEKVASCYCLLTLSFNYPGPKSADVDSLRGYTYPDAKEKRIQDLLFMNAAAIKTDEI